MARTEFDAIIMGAGLAGSAAAILLARAGWQVALVEKQRFPRRKVCGECLAASNFPLLDALGIGSEFGAAAGPPLRRFALMRGRRTVFADLPPAGSPHAWGRALGRETLDSLLLEKARQAGATVLQPWSVLALRGGAGDHHCDVRAVGNSDFLTLHAPVLIAAHGSWEALPSDRPARRARQGSSADLFAFKANFRNASLPAGLLPVLSFPGGYGGMVLADGGTTTLACCVRADRLEACRRDAPGLAAGEAVERMLRRECTGVGQALANACRDGPWLASGPIDPGIRLRADEHFFRIGNAAGEAHPIIGEGMSMALQSAFLLCGRLLALSGCADNGFAEQPASRGVQWQRAVQLAYTNEWRRHFSGRLTLAAGFAQLAMRPRLLALPMGLLRLFPSLLTQGARWAGKVTTAPSNASVQRLAGTVNMPQSNLPSPSSHVPTPSLPIYKEPI